MTLLIWYLQGFLTPLIGGIAVYIAWQQWKANMLKLRMERYERRLRVYQEVIKIISLIFHDPTVKQEDLLQFRTMTAEADFLFGEDIPQYIHEIYLHGLKLHTANTRRSDRQQYNTSDHNSGRIAADIDVHLKWLNEQFPVAKEKFKKYLDISK